MNILEVMNRLRKDLGGDIHLNGWMKDTHEYTEDEYYELLEGIKKLDKLADKEREKHDRMMKLPLAK